MSFNPLKWWQRIKEANAIITNAQKNLGWPRECYVCRAKLSQQGDDENVRVCSGIDQHVYRRDAKTGDVTYPDNFPKYEKKEGETI